MNETAQERSFRLLPLNAAAMRAKTERKREKKIRGETRQLTNGSTMTKRDQAGELERVLEDVGENDWGRIPQQDLELPNGQVADRHVLARTATVSLLEKGVGRRDRCAVAVMVVIRVIVIFVVVIVVVERGIGTRVVLDWSLGDQWRPFGDSRQSWTTRRSQGVGVIVVVAVSL